MSSGQTLDTRSRGIQIRPGAIPVRSPARRGPSRQRRRRQIITAYLFILPGLGLFALLGAYTVGYGFVLSLVDWNGLTPHWDWVGLGNYRDLLLGHAGMGSVVYGALARTVVVMVAATCFIVPISLLLAAVLNTVRRLQGILRTVYFLPYVTSGIAVFYAWRFILTPNGALNRALHAVGLGFLSQSQGFLGNPNTALPVTIAIMVWGAVPFGILLYLSGLQTIDPHLIEAARVDGASGPRILTAIVWPLLRPLTALLIAVSLQGALQNFQVFLLMTNGGPLDHTTTLSLLAFQYAFTNSSYGYASAMGWMLFVIGALLAVFTVVLLRRRS